MPILLIVFAIAALFGVGTYFLKPPAESTNPVTVSIAQEKSASTTFVTKAVPTTSTSSQTNTPNSTITPIAKTPEVTTPTSTKPPVTTPKPTPSPTPAPITPPVSATLYKSARYTANTDYNAPGRTNHTVAVAMNIKDDVVTDVSVSYGGDPSEQSSQYQKRFNDNIQTQVVGKKLDSISLTRVGGASLTTGAFNKALVAIKNTARS